MPGRSADESTPIERRAPTFVGTKFVPPPLPRVYAADPELVARVAASARGATATVIRAPGGSGKTTPARAVADATELPWAWLTLDEWDDGARLLELLHEGLRRTENDLADLRQLVTGASTPFSVRDTVTTLVNGLLDGRAKPVLLVLDDVHRIAARADAVELLTELLAMAPASLHLLLTSRAPLPMPVARLEAAGRVVEVAPDALRLSIEQTARILEEMGVSIGREGVERLVEPTGGWVTGIRLIADGGAATSDAVSRYVREELLAEFGDEDASTLTDLAVLRRIRPVDVTALTGRQDGVRWLTTIVDHLQVLVSRFEDGTVQFHDLLRDALFRELEADPDRLVRMHAAAAGTVDDWQEQLHHLVAARSFERAVDLLEGRRRSVFPRPAPLAQLRTLMDQVPRDLWEVRPWLRVVEGVTLAHRAEHAAAGAVLGGVAADLGDADVLGRWATLRYLQRCGDDPSARSEQLQRPDETSIEPSRRSSGGPGPRGGARGRDG